MTGHEPIMMTINVSGASVHVSKDIHPSVEPALGVRERSCSPRSEHETSITGSMKRKKKKHKRSSPVPKVVSFTVCQPPGSMVKDYSWMLDDEPSGPIPNQSNPKVILVDDNPCKGDKTSVHSQFLGNPFLNQTDIVAGPHGHNQAQSSGQSRGRSDNGNEGFCNLVQTTDCMILLSMVNQDNGPHPEILSNNDFAVLEGGCPVPYVPECFPGLFLAKPRAQGMIICGYSHTSIQDHPLNCQGHSYREGHDKVGMHPNHLGYTESVWVVKGNKEKYCTAVRRYHDLFLQPGF